jgi:hypothetical protein
LPAAPRRPLQFAKAGSAATLPQQEKNNSEDVQRGGFIPRGDVLTTNSSRWPIVSRRVRHRRQMFEPQLRHLRLWYKSRRGAPAVLLRAEVWRHALCDGAHCPCAASHAANDNTFSMSAAGAPRSTKIGGS